MCAAASSSSTHTESCGVPKKTIDASFIPLSISGVYVSERKREGKKEMTGSSVRMA
jgi:predicted nucleic acid-binding Zn ribbon protein